MNTMEAFLAKEPQEFACTMCERKFRKDSELVMHKQTHFIERQQNAKARAFQCSECKVVCKSKNLLNKHMEQVHNSNISTAMLNDHDGNNVYDNQAQTIGSHNALRTFKCTDCECAFRTHGVLSKHLRSKNHVRNLVNMGKLPEDANDLVRDNTHILANIDSTDCETAKSSLTSQLNKLRSNKPNTSTSNNSLECREQLTALSPTLSLSNYSTKSTALLNQTNRQLKNSNSQNNNNSIVSGYKKAVSSLPHGLKRKNLEKETTELDYPFSKKRCESALKNNNQQQNLKHINKNLHSNTFQNYLNEKNSPESNIAAVSPLHSLANIAAEQANWFSINGNHNNLSKNNVQITNVWVPPKVDQIEIDSKTGVNENKSYEQNSLTYNIMSNRSSEETSESNGRSESSTPVHKFDKPHSVLNGVAPPLNSTTGASKCQICDIVFDTYIEFQHHFQAEHVIMRDGQDFRCPQKHCSKIFPNRVSLRKHIALHFYGGNTTLGITATDDRDNCSPLSLTKGSPQSNRNVKPINATLTHLHLQEGTLSHASTVPSEPNKSPDAPEETHTTTHLGHIAAPSYVSNNSENSSILKHQYSATSANPQNEEVAQANNSTSLTESSLNLRCNLCGEHSANTDELQQHWIKHITSLNSSRPHVCQECDAGFTTLEALNAHLATHSS